MSSSRAPRRRRADAERSRAAILDAAIRLLAESPDAGMGAIATAAGVTRQTVYAHFPSRDDLLSAVVDRVTEAATAAMDAAELDEGPAADALLRLLDVGWRMFERHPVLLRTGSASMTQEDQQSRHISVADRLARLIQRGQKAGEFDPEQSPAWLVAATIALGHAAGDEVRAGRMSVTEAAEAARTAVLRVLGATAPHAAPD
ncbi:TetR/AcrR family transcriptional regulator [Streptomyces sp. NPDC004609]|uniref:TetR/AcrR family transcriptional regulator n=1 Tax=Streptomyces sp. NPDC004609 TaxID=3364704 RepID=UPI0036812CBF